MGIYAILAVGALAVGVHQYQQSQQQKQAKQQFLTECELEYDSDWCQAQHQAHHDLCFRRNNHRQSDGIRHNADVYIFRTKLYNNCLLEGYEAWNEALIAKNKAEQAFVKEHLN